MDSARRIHAWIVVRLLAATLLGAIGAEHSMLTARDKMKPEEVIAKHLESIAPAAQRAAVKSRVVLGTSVSTIRIGARGQAAGGAVVASEGGSILIGMAYGAQDYPLDKLSFNGKRLAVGEITPGVRSPLGEYLRNHEAIFREGLLTGALSTAWFPLNSSPQDFNLSYGGLEKLGDRRVHELRYRLRKNTSLRISMYFDAETFQHVRTEYRQTVPVQIASRPDVTSSQGSNVFRLTEDFSDFRQEGGLTLPHIYKLQFSMETQGGTYLQEWSFSFNQFLFNKPLGEKQFEIN